MQRATFIAVLIVLASVLSWAFGQGTAGYGSGGGGTNPRNESLASLTNKIGAAYDFTYVNSPSEGSNQTYRGTLTVSNTITATGNMNIGDNLTTDLLTMKSAMIWTNAHNAQVISIYGTNSYAGLSSGMIYLRCVGATLIPSIGFVGTGASSEGYFSWLAGSIAPATMTVGPNFAVLSGATVNTGTVLFEVSVSGGVIKMGTLSSHAVTFNAVTNSFPNGGVFNGGNWRVNPTTTFASNTTHVGASTFSNTVSVVSNLTSRGQGAVVSGLSTTTNTLTQYVSGTYGGAVTNITWPITFAQAPVVMICHTDAAGTTLGNDTFWTTNRTTTGCTVGARSSTNGLDSSATMTYLVEASGIQ